MTARVSELINLILNAVGLLTVRSLSVGSESVIATWNKHRSSYANASNFVSQFSLLFCYRGKGNVGVRPVWRVFREELKRQDKQNRSQVGLVLQTACKFMDLGKGDDMNLCRERVDSQSDDLAVLRKDQSLD